MISTTIDVPLMQFGLIKVKLVQCSDFKSGENGKNGLFKVRQSAKNPFEFQKESCYCVNKYCL